MKNKSVSVLAWHELTDMKWVPCGILDSLSVQFEHINEITFLMPDLQVSQLLINSHKLKQELNRNSLLILCAFNVFSMKP